MADGSWVFVDFVIISTLVRLVAKEVDFLEVFVSHVLQAVSLVPSSRENVKRDLATNGVSQAEVWELFLQGINELFSDFVLLVEDFVVVTLLGGSVSSNRRNIDHTVSELNESASSDWKINIRQVTQDELDKLVESLKLEELEERIELGCMPLSGSGSGLILWN